MDIGIIVAEIDAEIEKLRRIRHIIQGLSVPVRRLRREHKQVSVQPAQIGSSNSPVEIVPKIEILPPKKIREYRPRVRRALEMPKALAAAPSSRPVFVPRSAVPISKAAIAVPTLTATALELAVRQKLMGGIA